MPDWCFIRQHFALIVSLSFLVATLTSVGCKRESSTPPVSAPAVVTVSEPLVREIVDFERFTGRTQAVLSVDLQPRVSGHLDKIHFRPGQEVAEGDLLFEIDPRTYQAELDRLTGQVAISEASLQLAIAENKRGKDIAAKNPGAISKQDLDRYAAQESMASAQVDAAKANAEGARLDLEFTKIYAPIDGKISKSSIDPGNLVTANQTVLANIVSVNPMYVTFDMDERTMLLIQKLMREGKIKARKTSEVPLYLGLAGDSDYPHEGEIDYVDNRVDPTTGTLRVRGKFPNDKRVLTPGLFAKIKLPVGDPREAVLVAERALGTDQGQKFVYVVADDKKVEFRAVTVGMLENGLRVIEAGLKPGERVITNGLQRVRPGVLVDAQLAPMLGEEPATTAVSDKSKEATRTTEK